MDLKQTLAIIDAENPGFADEVAAERQHYELIDGIRRQLAALRKDAGVNQVEMGRRMGMSQSAISHFERGIGDIGLVTIFRYAAALNITTRLQFVSVSGEVTDISEPKISVASKVLLERKLKERRSKLTKFRYLTGSALGKFGPSSQKEPAKAGSGGRSRRSRKLALASGRPKGSVKS